MPPQKVFLADLGHTASVSDKSLTVPLGIGYVKAYADVVHKSEVDISLFKHPERFLTGLVKDRPSVIGFANYGWNENLNLAVGRYVRQVLPDALIVAGGPNIDPTPERRAAFLKRHSYVDYLIIDGGEEPFSELLAWNRDGASKDSLPANLVWSEDGVLRSTGERKLERIIDNIPSPYLNGSLDEFLAAGMVPMLETNRGCPFACTFCAWGSASKDLVRRLDLNTALAEIAYIGERSTALNWIVCDANFGILPRDVELAKAIRRVRDEKGVPRKCHIWLAKNVTERNLEIGAILGDMTVPVMAVQSLDEAVLENIKRDNISTATYVEYQKRFHKLGSLTYSDLIVPLPGETLASHLDALRRLLEYGVDIVQSHNMRLLAGAETNSEETRRTYGFRTRFRLIHGDAGAYRCPDGTVIKTFEYEESLRETTTMSEADLFYLRRLHFLVDFCWNIEVYKPLLKTSQHYGLSPVDALRAVLERAKGPVAEFFERFDEASRNEWFDSAEAIESHFADERQFNRLLRQEFEKLNVMFSVLLLKDFKTSFDEALLAAITSEGRVPPAVLADASAYAFALFPPLDAPVSECTVSLPVNYDELDATSAATFAPSATRRSLRLVEGPKRSQVRQILRKSQGQTLSKILNTQGIILRDLKLALADAAGHDKAFRRAD